VSDIAGIASGFYENTVGKLAAQITALSDQLDRLLCLCGCGMALIPKSKPNFPGLCCPDELFGVKSEPAS
jgi:hypothetical protein